MPLTEQQARFFDVFGYLSLPGLFADKAEAITEAFEAVWEEHGGGHNERPQSSDGNYFVGDTAWHSDGYSRAPGYRSIKLTFYLDPVGRDTGCLRVVPGSHKIGEVYAETVHETIPTSGSNNSQDSWGIPGTEVPSLDLEMQRGDLIVFNHRIKHASFGGSTRRGMFTVNLQQRFRNEDEDLLRECIGNLAGFWYERVYSPPDGGDRQCDPHASPGTTPGPRRSPARTGRQGAGEDERTERFLTPGTGAATDVEG